MQARAETSRGRNFGAEFISFSITSLADNLIGGAATRTPLPFGAQLNSNFMQRQAVGGKIGK